MKRYVTIVLLVLILGGALGFFFYSFWRKMQSRPLEEALLQNTALYITTSDALKSFPEVRNMPYGATVYTLPVLAKLEQQLAAFDSVLRATGYTLGNTRMIASLYATGAEQFDWLFLVDGGKTEAEQLLGKLKAISGAKVSKRIYKDETVLDILMPGESVPFSCASLNGILMGSFSAFLVEESIMQLREKDPISKTQKGYRKISQLTSQQSDLSIFINPGQLRALAKQFIDEQQSPLLAHLEHFSSWLALDINFRNGGILLGGYTLADSSGILSTFHAPASQKFAFEHALPLNTAYFAAQEIELDLENQGPAATYFNGWLQPFACYGIIEPLDNNYRSEWFLVMPVTDEQLARESLAEMARTNATGTMFTDKQDAINIGQLVNDSSLAQTLGLGAWLPLYNPYYALHNGHVFFANDVNTLKEMLRKINTGYTLANSPSYINYAQEVSNINSLYIYLNPAYMGAFLPSLLHSNILDGGNSEYKNFSPIGLQFNYDDGVFFTIALLQYRTGGNETIANKGELDTPVATTDVLAWRVALDAQLIGKPHLVTNHNTGELEIFVQDATNNIYLINKAGKILWKKAMVGVIMGDVYQMDLYKNSKLQMLFNTADKIHLIDRNGNTVEQFPIGLAAKATNGLCMLDDGKKNYQYFVACENYKVYGYTANGKPLQGWNPKPRVGTITYPLQYTENQGKDYLILTNVDGTLLYYNKQGERHEKPIRLEATFNQPFCIHPQGKGFVLLNASASRMLFSVDAKGNAKETTAEAIPPYYSFTCAMGDSSVQYIFVAADKVTFTSPDLVSLATFVPKQPLDLPVQVVKGKSAPYVVVGSSTGNEIYLLDIQGNLLQGAPFKGNTQVAAGPVFDTDRPTIIAGDAAGNVNAYRLP
ncbi:hypothetical protein BH09BAC1_BH09BAC1_05490 [soil metagenome]